MNRIKDFSLEGFKSIRKADFEFTNLNVLIGANGAGKSNLIGFFRMLNYLQSGALQTHVGAQGGANALLHYGAKKTPQLSATINFETRSGFNRYHMRLIHAAGDTLIFADEEITFSRRDTETQGPTISLGAGHRESGLIAQSEKERKLQHAGKKTATTATVIRNMMGAWQVFQFHDTSSTANIKQFHYLDDDHFFRADGGNLAPFLYHLHKDKPEYYRRILETIRLCAPFFGDFVLIPNDKKIILNWKEHGADMLFGPHHLSDGTLRLMALVTLLLQPHLPSMIIIDEPELGLHPYAITVLGGLLKKASVSSQLLISTQSVSLIDQFDAEDIITVDRENEQSVFRRQNSEKLEGWLKEYSLSELWEKNVLGGRPS